ncbi:CBO0543 family protein [Effusibacillus consociatus]|uniref:CBO0543 family protein n=2 Tax=Effusibacillus consociatus TaxID=1117041 RepID=A0ABV9PZV3_9BACL
MIVWLAWMLFADKKRWRELLPVGILGSALGSTTDNIMEHYKLWEYHGGGHPLIPALTDDWGIFLVIPYLFIQWLPKQQTFGNLFVYWFMWTGITTGIEWIYVTTNHMHYHKWWHIGYSYLADWFLFCLFYQFHKNREVKETRTSKQTLL